MKRDFLKLLKTLDEEELREELKVLYDRFPTVRSYYKMELSPTTRALLDKYKKDVRKAFFPGRGRRMGKRGRSESKRIIKEFTTISIHQKDVLELLFYRVEVMLEAGIYYYVESEGFYNSVLVAFRQAAKLAEQEILVDTFEERARELVETSGKLPYPLVDIMYEIYDRFWS